MTLMILNDLLSPVKMLCLSVVEVIEVQKCHYSVELERS